MNEPGGRSQKSSSFQVSISSLTLGTLYEGVLAFSSQDSFETLWPSVCQNVRWLIPSRRMGILLCSAEEGFEIAGMFEHGGFQKPVDSRFTPEGDELERALAQKNAQWIKTPWHPMVEERSPFTQWLLQDHPDMLFVLPVRVKGRTIGALLFATASLAETDQAMLSTLGTIYALHVGMTYALLRISEERKEMQNQLILQEKMASLGSLVAGIAHEINSPIGTLQCATDVVSRCVKRIESLFGGGKPPEDVSIDEWCQKVHGSQRKYRAHRSRRRPHRQHRSQFKKFCPAGRSGIPESQPTRRPREHPDSVGERAHRSNHGGQRMPRRP